MTFTDKQLADAARALGVEWIMYPCLSETMHEDIGISRKKRTLAFGPGFAEWAIPILEERHGVIEGGFSDRAEITIWSVNNVWYVGIKWFLNHNPLPEIIIESGPDIDTATLLLAAKIGEGME